MRSIIHGHTPRNMKPTINTVWKQKNLICFVSALTLPIWLCSDTVYLSGKKKKKKPSWLISSILADGGKQKYRNDCTHCPPFEKRYPGKSSREQKNKKIQDAAIITLGYPVLSHGIYQWPPCLGFDPQLLQKSQENKGQEMSLPLWTAETKSNLAQLTTWTMTTRLAV